MIINPGINECWKVFTSSITRDGPVVPAVLLEGVDGGDVVAGHPPYLPAGGVRLAPLPALVVAQDTHLFP